VGQIARVLVLVVAFSCAAGVCRPQVDRDDSRSFHPPSQIPPESRIDINHATLQELLKAPGMTRSWALRILRFRPYRTKQDLLDDGVVPSEVYARIRDYLIAHKDKQ
jgi:DNA uptake protein ComE-like DNA-binding protein